MAGADGQALLDLLPQIQALFSDSLRVVSYKWLSRNFSVSSNDAKRLLQEFVDQHGNDLQVIYSVSGWLKNNPQNYCVKLTSGLKLEEARQEFKDSCSVQVYSIQACVLKDTAVLWNAEFVQAEEFFNQPFDEENCLRDNRFCGVTNSFVKRTADKKHVSPLPARPVTGVLEAAQSKPSSILKEQPVPARQQVLSGPSSPKQGTGNKNQKDNCSLLDISNNAPVVKELAISVQASKTKGQNGKALSSNGASLATMWGCASAKPRTPTTTESTAITNVDVTADAQICANEAADAGSSDDEQGIHYKRNSSSANNRKRKVVFDFSDDDEKENVISIASPELPKQHAPNPVSEVAEDIIPKRRNLEDKQEIPSNTKDNTKGMASEFTSECGIKSVSTINHSGITLKEKGNIPPANDNKQDHASEPNSSSPKRKKVLKTRIDERGREVTEVVWEGEAPASDNTEKSLVSTDVANRTTLPSEPQPAANTGRSNASSKTAANKKPAKGGAKNTKQGNILSFFKKI